MANSRLCSIPDCGKPVRARGYCESHYRKLKRSGDPNGVRAPYQKSPEVCTVDGCNRKPLGKGLCHNHYRRMSLYGDPLGMFTKPPQRHCSLPGCRNLHIARGFCKKHYNRFMSYGDPYAGQTPMGTVQHWLHDHKDHEGDECLDWPFAKHPEGYGQARDVTLGRGVNAHRIMCTLAHGSCPEDKDEVAHSCGNGHLGCINPKHLRWATRSENCNDRTGHGKQNRGERCGMAKLNRDQVREIRSLKGIIAASALAARYSVSSTTIYSIHSRRLWGWLP